MNVFWIRNKKGVASDKLPATFCCRYQIVKKFVQNEKLKHEAIKICLCRLYKIVKNIIYKDGILSSLHPRIVHYLLPNLIRLSKPYI